MFEVPRSLTDIAFVTKAIKFVIKSYIGQTSGHLKNRIKEHLPTCVVKFIEKKTQKYDNSNQKRDQ